MAEIICHYFGADSNPLVQRIIVPDYAQYQIGGESEFPLIPEKPINSFPMDR
jgi:hypothetical protein